MEAILNAKKQYDNIYILKYSEEQIIVFRLLTWGEFKVYRNIINAIPAMYDDVMEDIFKTCLIQYGEPGCNYKKVDRYTQQDIEDGFMELDDVMEFMPAGIGINISDIIYSLSGATDKDKLFEDLDNARFYLMNDAENIMTSMASSLFGYKLKDFDNMNWESVSKIIAATEMIMSGKVPELPFQPAKEQTNEIDFEKENRDDDI